ncbi:MAG: alpha/beta fold hydrolase [Ghiorsea sp.]|nr:alpha/beta fold hydrolase [Ghiorsea sp.]
MTSLPNIIFLHGWGQSTQIWHQQITYFSPFTRTYTINLPGHGGAGDIKEPQWIAHLNQEIEYHINTHQQPTILVGWSLGGQIALTLQAALQDKLAGLVLVSTTPAFRQQNHWLHGCSDEVWQGFEQASQQQTPKLMQRFFQMMLHGDKLSRKEMQNIAKTAINKESPPTTQGLATGLNLLSDLDNRPFLGDIQLPTLVVHGAQDVIVPTKAGQYLAARIPNTQLQIFEDCGHAPFLTHHVAFNQLLESWWKNLSM